MLLFPFLISHTFLFLRRVRGILNKITPEKFEKLIADILNIIGQGSNVVFKGVIVLVGLAASSHPISSPPPLTPSPRLTLTPNPQIFEKALDEPHF